MKKFKTAKGYIAYKAKAAETALLGGIGICDDCGQAAAKGFLVPVLNHYMCPNCFHDWEAHGTYYPQDAEIEAKNARYYEQRIPLEETKDWLSTRIALEKAVAEAVESGDDSAISESFTDFMQYLSKAICKIVNPVHENNAPFMIAALELTAELIKNLVPCNQKIVESIKAIPAFKIVIPFKGKEEANESK